MDDAARKDYLRLAFDAAVRCGQDTVIVPGIAGGLIGAVQGASTVPRRWREMLRGRPGLGSRDLIDLATAIVRSDRQAP